METGKKIDADFIRTNAGVRGKTGFSGHIEDAFSGGPLRPWSRVHGRDVTGHALDIGRRKIQTRTSPLRASHLPLVHDVGEGKGKRTGSI
ncbi:hypothetical protein [Sorangium cellulosum]|uniref:hypothetical protein n=1 Tax=Sorangium cellulosum TaxID=56 RepID=UPI000ACBDC7D|nr:hypothetical protein [Sorangium cellulosum]